MSKTREKTIRQMAVSELERLLTSLDESLDRADDSPLADVEYELREMGVDPERLPPLSLSQILSYKGEQMTPAYVYVSNELLLGEYAPGEVKLLMLKIRFLSRQRRYAEALELARQAILRAPRYWRAWISYGSLQSLLGDLDEGEAVFRRVRKEFSADPKAVAAALHGCACVKEVRGELNPSEDDLRDVLRLYEEALELDESRVNTRACFVINSLLSRQTDRGLKVFESSLLCEGFFEAMLLERRERELRDYGAKMYRVAQVLPLWFRDLMDGAVPGQGADAATALDY
jgi:tetratricopeptide (TPR) repeat protein